VGWVGADHLDQDLAGFVPAPYRGVRALHDGRGFVDQGPEDLFWVRLGGRALRQAQQTAPSATAPGRYGAGGILSLHGLRLDPSAGGYSETPRPARCRGESPGYLQAPPRGPLAVDLYPCPAASIPSDFRCASPRLATPFGEFVEPPVCVG